MTNFELVKKIESLLQCENPEFEARQMVISALNTDNTGFVLEKRNEAEQETIEKAFEMAEKRNNNIPLYYILGICEFYSLEFFVGEGVLVPRDDTEILVDEALTAIKDIKNPRVLDLCSGSGAIAVAIGKNRPDSSVDAVELYDGAFNYLQKNIEHNEVSNVTAIKADALEFTGEYDLVVSNPPYISLSERKDLSKEVLKEPDTALFADNNGLIFYEKIAENFKINKKFTLIFEIGYKMKAEVIDILRKNGYSHIETIEDYGKNTRVIKVQK